MSIWDNVNSVDKVLIRAGTGFSQGATLSLNGRHQIPIMFCLQFNLKDTSVGSPTASDVLQALNLIDFVTGADASHIELVSGAPTDYNRYYYSSQSPIAPNVVRDARPRQVRTSESATSWDVILQLALQPKADRPNDDPETISFKLVGATSTDTPYTESFGKDGKHQDYISLNLIQQKQYGGPDSTSLTPIVIFSQQDSNTSLSPATGIDAANDGGTIQQLRINDQLFHIHDWTTTPGTTGDLNSDRLCCVRAEKWSTKVNQIYNTFLLSKDYGIDSSDRSISNDQRRCCGYCNDNSVDFVYGTITSSFTLFANSIAFQTYSAIITGPEGDNAGTEYVIAIFDILDQYGNATTISISYDPVGNPVINSVVSSKPSKSGA